jgi:hypothetical protein
MPDNVDQVSRPYLIALAAAAVFAVAWLTVLHPRTSTGDTRHTAAAAPGTAGLGRAVGDAKGAVRASEASAQRAQAASGASPAPPTAGSRRPATTGQASPAAPRAAGAPARPAIKRAASTPVDRSAPLLREMARGHAVVLLFTTRGADDRASRAAVATLARRHRGRVDVHLARISRVGDYGAITAGVQVLQAPTMLVIAPGGRTQSIVGLTSGREIDQAVAAAFA